MSSLSRQCLPRPALGDDSPAGMGPAGRAPEPPGLFFSQNESTAWTLALSSTQPGQLPLSPVRCVGRRGPSGWGTGPGTPQHLSNPGPSLHAVSQRGLLCSPWYSFPSGASALSLLGPAWCWAGGQRVREHWVDAGPGGVKGDGRGIEVHVPVAWRYPQVLRANPSPEAPEASWTRLEGWEVGVT